MAREKVLVVDDEGDILKLLEYNLSKEGYVVTCVMSGEEALEKISLQQPAIMVLDLMLPGIDGLEVCRRLKLDSRTSGIPIIILSAKGEDADVVAGLEFGADDYVTKPFSPKILTARIRNVLRRKRRKESEKDSAIKIHDLIIDLGKHEVIIKNRRVDMTATEFNLLTFLAGRPGRVFTRNQIIDVVKGIDRAVTERSVDVQVVGLRRKLGPAGNYIETVHGVGYRFME